MKNIKIELVFFTPEMAEEIINKPSVNYRNPKTHVVNQYAKDMKEGKWVFCGDSIKFDKDGNCIDGQHRLRAIVKSGCGQWFIRVDGLEPESAQNMDSGFKRSIEDYLKKQAEAYEAGATAIVKQSAALSRNSKHMGQGISYYGLTYANIVDMYTNDSEWYNKAAKYGKKVSTDSARILKPTEVGAIYYYLTRVMRIDSDYVEDFFFKLCSAKLNDKSIFKTTIKNLNDPEYIKRSGTKRIDEYIACWNAMLHGCTVQRKDYSDWFEKPNLKKTFVLTEENELSEAEAQ